MSFLDKAKEAAKSVGEKAQEGIKAGEKKIDETKTKRRIADLKQELGGVIYAERTGAPTSESVTEIDRLVEEIREAEAQLRGESPA